MIKIRYADSYFKRLLGLMFKKDIDYGLLFILKYGSSIHTCFMRFTIDAYFLDENKVIIDKTTLKPWKFYRPSKKARYILETKENFLNLKKGEKIEFK
ncbi:MAG: DUF192 domain-containing protein [Methanobrevibacter sp.]|nr:DUF192 domain-containing protein [Methanobrevibacter sp.]